MKQHFGPGRVFPCRGSLREEQLYWSRVLALQWPGPWDPSKEQHRSLWAKRWELLILGDCSLRGGACSGEGLVRAGFKTCKLQGSQPIERLFPL